MGTVRRKNLIYDLSCYMFAHAFRNKDATTTPEQRERLWKPAEFVQKHLGESDDDPPTATHFHSPMSKFLRWLEQQGMHKSQSAKAGIDCEYQIAIVLKYVHSGLHAYA